MTKTISVAKLRENIGEVFDDVAFKGTVYTVVKHGKVTGQISFPDNDKVNNTKITPEFIKHIEDFTNRYKEDFKKLAER